MEACELQEQTHQANPAGPHFGTHERYREDQARQEGKTGDAVEKRHDSRTRVEALLVRPPRLQRTAGHVKHLGRLTLGHPLDFEIAIALTLLRPFEAIPALMAILIATLRILDDCSHRYLLFRSFASVCVMAKDGEVAFWFQPAVMASL
jgi:hypothetical protein